MDDLSALVLKALGEFLEPKVDRNGAGFHQTLQIGHFQLDTSIRLRKMSRAN